MIGPKHALALPPGQRGRRVRWRVGAFSVYFALQGAAMWAVHTWGWPEAVAIPVVAVPYWVVVTAIWSRFGPEVPGLS